MTIALVLGTTISDAAEAILGNGQKTSESEKA
jgi:hypothetical protein